MLQPDSGNGFLFFPLSKSSLRQAELFVGPSDNSSFTLAG